MATYVGRPLKRFEDPRLVTGQGLLSMIYGCRACCMRWCCAVRMRTPVSVHRRCAARRAAWGCCSVTASDIVRAVRETSHPGLHGSLRACRCRSTRCWPATSLLRRAARGGGRGPGPLYRQRCSGFAAGGV